MNKKITVITPVYNADATVIETMSSVINQNYNLWQHILIDDGSVDSSYDVINTFISKSAEPEKYKLMHQENADQLNAILLALEEVEGDYVFILHSDDILASNDVFSNALAAMAEDSELDAVISNLNTMDADGIFNGVQVVKDYTMNDYTIANQLLQLGRNQFVDVAFYKTESFKESVKYNYLTWNTPFWLDLRTIPKQLKVKKIAMPMISYRVFEGNYINSEIGNFNVLNGELRTAISLMKYYAIPLYSIQNFVSRIFNKLKIPYRPFFIYSRKESKNYDSVIETIISKRYPNTENRNIYLDALVSFYKNCDNGDTLRIDDLGENFVLYKGKDIRIFANQLFADNLPSIYNTIIAKMSVGFSTIVCNEKDKDHVSDMLLFLNISNKVKVEVI